jgi:tetratricopeptide (TPR) repeat protein
MLISAQAHALVLAGERTEAYNLLQRLAKENLLGSRDQLDLGIVLLIESQKKNKQALAYIEAARKTIGDHPRVLAALALALQKTERIDEASELLEQVQISLQGGEDRPARRGPGQARAQGPASVHRGPAAT